MHIVGVMIFITVVNIPCMVLGLFILCPGFNVHLEAEIYIAICLRLFMKSNLPVHSTNDELHLYIFLNYSP